MQVAKKLELHTTFVHMDADEGWKISYFVEDARILDYHNLAELSKAVGILA